LKGYVKDPEKLSVKADNNFRQNVKNLFYPSED
jgi:hypothetical protein